MRTSTGSSGLLALCLVAFCLACPLRIAADYDMDDAVGLWLLDDGEGDVAKDSSATGDHGKLWRGPTWVDGRFGKALHFDGQSFIWIKEAKGIPEGTTPPHRHVLLQVGRHSDPDQPRGEQLA